MSLKPANHLLMRGETGADGNRYHVGITSVFRRCASDARLGLTGRAFARGGV